MDTLKIKDQKSLEKLFSIRYQIFVVRDKEAPENLYPNKLLQDSVDDNATHFGCFENGELLGFLTVVNKKDVNHLPVEEQHNLKVENNSIEVMRLIIDPTKVLENEKNKRGKILQGLFSSVYRYCKENDVEYLYLVSTKEAKSTYDHLGFKQVGDYRLYKGISNECPMKLNISEVNKNIGV